MNAKFRCTLLCIRSPRFVAAVAVLLFFLPCVGQANPSLINLTSEGASIAAGNAKCPGRPFFRYIGGKRDSFASPADSAYPSQNLAIFMTNPHSVVQNDVPMNIVQYDVPMNNGKFGDSFNLQNTRSACYALIQFSVTPTGDIPSNDSLTLGHVENGLFIVVAQVINPRFTTRPQTYALNSTGLELLSNITGVSRDKTPLDSILDVYLQNDTEIDFIKLLIWYGPETPTAQQLPTCTSAIAAGASCCAAGSKLCLVSAGHPYYYQVIEGGPRDHGQCDCFD